MYRREPYNAQAPLAGEDQLLELISARAPLPKILDRVCAAVDEQLGSVVSLVLLVDDAEHALHTFEQSAETFGLTLFRCAPIVSLEGEFLGTLETYCCFPRQPTLSEIKLIEQAANLAALAIDLGDWPLNSKTTTGRGSCEEPPSIN